jgi:hypothetical protein
MDRANTLGLDSNHHHSMQTLRLVLDGGHWLFKPVANEPVPLATVELPGGTAIPPKPQNWALVIRKGAATETTVSQPSAA